MCRGPCRQLLGQQGPCPRKKVQFHLHRGFQLQVHVSRVLTSWQELDGHQRSAKWGTKDSRQQAV